MVDGAFIKKNIVYLFEIKYLKGEKLPIKTMQNIHNMIEEVKHIKDRKIKLMFVIVHKSGFGEKIQKQLYANFEPGSSIFQFKFYCDDKLKKHYGI